jgi:uncharacterized FlaG/YvyC family protein
MDISNTSPLDDAKGPKDAPQRPASEHEREVGQNTAAEAQAPNETPDSDGVVASSHVEGATVRDASEPKQSGDYAAAASRLSQLVESLRQQTGFEGTARVAIDIDEKTSHMSFLLVDKDKGSVLHRIPEDEFLPLLRDLVDRGGLMVDREL